MNIRINRSSQTPIYLQIKCAIQNLILSGELSPGYKMPAERKLAGELDIHRNTVIKAYGELVDEGYLIVSSKRPKGYFVKEIADDGVPFKRFFPLEKMIRYHLRTRRSCFWTSSAGRSGRNASRWAGSSWMMRLIPERA